MGMPAGDRIENGKRVFVAQGCNNCHGTVGQGGSAAGIAGPRLSPPPQSLTAFVTQVREPRGEMPPYSVAKVSNADLEDVYTFLKFNQTTSTKSLSAGTPATGNAQHGKVLYADYGCYSCHGRHAEGSTATGPRLNPSPVPLDTFIRYLRHPTGDMPPYTGKVASDADLADIFAFLQTLPAPPNLQSIPLLK
jgi:mono/diheme cytochrome c family protein